MKRKNHPVLYVSLIILAAWLIAYIFLAGRFSVIQTAVYVVMPLPLLLLVWMIYGFAEYRKTLKEEARKARKSGRSNGMKAASPSESGHNVLIIVVGVLAFLAGLAVIYFYGPRFLAGAERFLDGINDALKAQMG